MPPGPDVPPAPSESVADLLSRIERVYFHDPAQAQVLAEQAYTLAQERRDAVGAAGALMWRGIVQMWSGDHASARASLEAARQGAQAHGDVATEARSLNNLAILAYRLGDYVDAMQGQLEQLTLTQHSGDLAGQLRARLNISMVHAELDEHEASLREQREVLRLARRLKLSYVAAAAQESVATSLLKLDRFEEAARTARRALAPTRRLGASLSLAGLQRTLAAALCSLGQPEAALEACEAGLPVADLARDDALRCELLVERGRALALTGRLDEALDALERAGTLAQETGLRRERCEALGQQARVLEQRSDLAAALEALRSHFELDRELRAEGVARRTRALTARFEAERFRHQAEVERERSEALERANRELTLAHRRLAHLAEHDALTGLPGRAVLERRLGSALASGRPLAVMFVDLDRFKSINDTLGHEEGDRVLCEVARRLRFTLGEGPLLVRLGGDEFIVLMEGLVCEEGAQAVASQLREALSNPLTHAGQRLYVTASVGLALAPRDGREVAELLRRADTAMYRVKQKGRNGVLSYSPSMAAELESRLILEQELHGALARGELHLHYQAQWQLGDHEPRLRGVEALLRWQHPRLGRVSPSRFVPLAEEAGLIMPIGSWVLREATQQAARWHAEGLELNVAVNVSAIQFGRPDFVSEVEEALHDSGLPASALELELTESTVMRDTVETARHLEHLRALGVRVAIDDFGTGHASLGLLRRLKVNTLKVDRSFVQDLTTRQDARPLVEAILALARGLGLSVVAEGAETEAQLSALRELGCAEVQGYLLAHPLSAEALTPLLAHHLEQPAVTAT